VARSSFPSFAGASRFRDCRTRKVQGCHFCRILILVVMVLLIGVPVFTESVRASAQVSQFLGPVPVPSHSPVMIPAARSRVGGASTLGGVLSDSLGNAVPGATVDVDPAGTNCLGTTPVASTTTGPGGSFSVLVSPATYDVWVNYPGDSTDPAFAVCTDSVDLSASVTDALTFPVTRLTVTARDASGDPVQGATVLGSGQTESTFSRASPSIPDIPTSLPIRISRPAQQASPSFP
jgi:hypothetical protein